MHNSDYSTKNNSFKTKLVYRIGSDSGFFSEINNMILAMVYCIERKIQFQLYSKNGSYSYDAWLDFFKPFTIHREELFHQAFNFRPYTSPLPEEFVIEELLEKRNKEKILLTQHIWDEIGNVEIYNLNKVLTDSIFQGKLLSVTKELIKTIWIYNDETESVISSYTNEIQVLGEYDALHIRRGDKINEIQRMPKINEYFEKLDFIAKGKTKPIFIATDDYSILSEIKTTYPEREIFHFERPENKGFDMGVFSDLEANIKYEKITQFLAEIEMLNKSRFFVGSFSSNIAMFLGMIRGGENVYGVDAKEWLNWRGPSSVNVNM